MIKRDDCDPALIEEQDVKAKLPRQTKRRADALHFAAEADFDRLLGQLGDYPRNKRQYVAEDGKNVEGYLLESYDCDRLVYWCGVSKPQRRGRPPLLPSLFGNLYKVEFEKEKQRIAAAQGNMRGVIKQATAVLAARHRVEFDTMRKRIKGR